MRICVAPASPGQPQVCRRVQDTTDQHTVGQGMDGQRDVGKQLGGWGVKVPPCSLGPMSLSYLPHQRCEARAVVTEDARFQVSQRESPGIRCGGHAAHRARGLAAIALIPVGFVDNGGLGWIWRDRRPWAIGRFVNVGTSSWTGSAWGATRPATRSGKEAGPQDPSLWALQPGSGCSLPSSPLDLC